MKKVPRISEAEWEVMKVLWDASPITANQIVEILSKRTFWQRETIRTLINRLVRKKAIQFEKQGRQPREHRVGVQGGHPEQPGQSPRDPAAKQRRTRQVSFGPSR